MKKLVLLTLMLVSGVFAYAQTATTHQWNKTTHDFGKVTQNVPPTCEFKLTNKGTTPLVITTVSPTCGCTTPEYTKEAIAAGKTGFVKATFNAASPGPFSKTITITLSNGVTEVLTIKGEVIAATTPMTPPAKTDKKSK